MQITLIIDFALADHFCIWYRLRDIAAVCGHRSVKSI